MPVCPTCGRQRPDGVTFCDECGTRLNEDAPASAGVLACPKCGAQLESGGNFCDMCGAPVGTAATAVPSSPPPVSGRLIVQSSHVSLPLPSGLTEVVIGRKDPHSGFAPEVDLTDHGGTEGGVSREHARLFVRGGQLFIEDLESTNGTFVNQQKLSPGRPRPVRDGDEIRLGWVRLWFRR
jgi:hypothetical protein